jgi:hypothetical protein
MCSIKITGFFQTQESILLRSTKLERQLNSFALSDAVAKQWLQHRNSEHAWLDQECERVQAALQLFGRMKPEDEDRIRTSIHSVGEALQIQKVLICCRAVRVQREQF